MILTMIRHGETDYNKQRLVQGRMDNPLNEHGKNQARTTGQLLKDLNDTFDILGTSPLKRAYETAEIVGSYLDMNVEFTFDGMLERDFGSFEGKSIDLALPVCTDDQYKEPGFENNEILASRIKQATYDLYQEFEDKKVLFVAHSHVIKTLLILSDKSKYTYTNHYVGNSSVCYFNVTKDKIELIKQIDL
ncbi:histidine phosphatase family protein [Acholeplasma equirhinis]|uniref:histidine phosphatase family protein n=1 Tax=Acholeplasma equirhinis TaxID=555393 RepID=UPI00197AC26E|nr:histidine phosphatase family protein [Acholeplasma equirhinis]MBN3490371.1 histidine phosphatase family protein [Acholeplasma equirhinis]